MPKGDRSAKESGGKKSVSGRGKPENTTASRKSVTKADAELPTATRSAAGKKAAATRQRKALRGRPIKH